VIAEVLARLLQTPEALAEVNPEEVGDKLPGIQGGDRRAGNALAGRNSTMATGRRGRCHGRWRSAAGMCPPDAAASGQL
jgi:hypothetical protein